MLHQEWIQRDVRIREVGGMFAFECKILQSFEYDLMFLPSMSCAAIFWRSAEGFRFWHFVGNDVYLQRCSSTWNCGFSGPTSCCTRPIPNSLPVAPRRNFLWLYQPALGSLAVSRTCNVCRWLRTLLQMISSNFCQDIRAAGLVPNHAYSLIDVRILIILISLFCWMAYLQCLRNMKFDRGVGCSWCRPLTQTLSFMESHQFYNHVRRSLKQDEVSYSEILLRLSYLHTGITNLFCCLIILSCSIMVDIGLSFLAWPTLNNFVMFHIWRNKTLETETLTPAPPLPPPHPWLEWSTLYWDLPIPAWISV